MTAQPRPRLAARRPGATGTRRALLVTAGVTTLAGGLGAALGAGLGGRPAALAALVGTAVTVVILLGGALWLDAVAGVLPSASLLVALLTYSLQLLVLLATLVALEGSGLLGDVLDRGWLGGTIIVATLIWIAVQLRMFCVARVPVFDLPAATPRLDRREGGH